MYFYCTSSSGLLDMLIGYVYRNAVLFHLIVIDTKYKTRQTHFL